MDLNATIDIIIKDLNDVRDIIDDLKKYQGVPSLQIELAKSKCKSAADVISLLKDIISKPVQGSQGKDEKTVHESREEQVLEIDNTMVEEKVTPVVNLKVNIQKEEAGKTEEEVRPDVKRTHVNESAFGPATEVRNTLKKQAGNPIIADQFNNLGDSINEKMGSLKHDDDITEFLKNKPLANLTDAIGINDRFLFIREIFNGDSEKYSEAILRLNSAISLDEASNLVAGYTHDDTDAGAIRQLMDLLKRKYRPNE